MEYVSKQRSDDIVDRLARIEEKVDNIIITMTAHVAEDHQIFHGVDNREGLLIQHAKLMSSYKMWRAIFGAALGAVMTVLADVIVRGHF